MSIRVYPGHLPLKGPARKENIEIKQPMPFEYIHNSLSSRHEHADRGLVKELTPWHALLQ